MAEKGKSKAEIAKEKSLITKQRIKEKEKASTKTEKKDLDAAHKRVTGGGIHAGKPKKGKDVEIKTKKKNIRPPRPKTIQHADKGNFRKPEPKSKDKIAKEKSKKALERKRAGIKVSTPKKHPAHDPDKGGGIHKGKPPKGAQATEVEIKKKPLSPEQKKKDKAIMKAEEARRKKAKAKAKSKKAKKDSAAIMKSEKKRRAEAKKDMPTGRSAAASGAAKAKDISMQRKKYVLGTLKDKPSGKK